MGMIQLRERWRRQPDRPVDIDWSHPLSPDLRFFVVFIGGVPVDLVTGAIGARNGSAAIQPSGIPAGGGTVAKLASSSSDYYDFAHRAEWEILGELTLAWRGVISTGSAFRHFAGKHASGGATNNPFDFRTTNDAAPKFALVRSAASGSSSNHWSNSDPLSLGVPQTAEVTQGALLDTTPTFYANGVQTAVFTNSTGPASPATASGVALRVGRRADGVVQMDGYTEYVVGWARQLSAAELREFRIAPYDLLQPRSTPIFFTAGGATSGAGASAGAGAASATSQATWAAVGASAGAGTGAATSQATWAAVGASAGAGAASATGTDANGGISSATAASSGAGAASATSQATWATVGASAGVGAGAATSRTVAASIGASAGAGTGAATSQTVAASIGASAGTGAAAATGDDANSAFSSATAASSGTGAAAATSRATWATVAASSAVSSVAATANAVWAGVATSAGAATASADGVTDSAVQAAVGSATGSAAGSAVARIVAAVAGAAAGAAVASGVSDALSAVVEAAGAAVAVAVASAAAHAIWNAVGSSAGSTTASGASPTVLDAVAVAQQIVVRTAEAIVVVTSRGLASKVVTDG